MHDKIICYKNIFLAPKVVLISYPYFSMVSIYNNTLNEFVQFIIN